MKKLLLLILTVVMVFGITGCGSANNDENNAAIQAKVDEADALAQDIITWYMDNGYTEGDNAAEIQAVIDSLTEQMVILKEAHQENMDAGGYSDTLYAEKSKNLDDIIASYNEAQEAQLNYTEVSAAGTAIEALTETYNELATIVNETATLATTNGWDIDEAYTSELAIIIELLTVVGEDIQNPDTMDEEYMNTVKASLDELIPVWQDYFSQVSEAYVAE